MEWGLGHGEDSRAGLGLESGQRGGDSRSGLVHLLIQRMNKPVLCEAPGTHPGRERRRSTLGV